MGGDGEGQGNETSRWYSMLNYLLHIFAIKVNYSDSFPVDKTVV